MSKKENITPEATEASKTNTLIAAMDAAVAEGKIAEYPTLKAMAAVFGLNPQRLYAVAKTPKEGEIYDARVYNWDAIEKFVLRRLSDDMTIEAFVEAAIEKNAELALQDGRKGPRISDAERYVKYSEGLMPRRKYDVSEGSKILLKKDKKNVYVVVLASDTHVVIAPENYPTEYKVFANWTFNSNVIAPYRFDEVLAARQAEITEEKTTEEATAE